jgi:hypothetical protein
MLSQAQLVARQAATLFFCGLPPIGQREMKTFTIFILIVAVSAVCQAAEPSKPDF